MRRLPIALALLAAAATMAGCTSATKEPVPPPAEGGPTATTGWQRTTLPSPAMEAPSAQLSALLPPAGSAGWLAAGTIFEQGRSSATIWRSANAVNWSMERLADSGNTVIQDAVRRGDQLILVGYEITGRTTKAAVWAAKGGERPKRLSSTPGLQPDGGRMTLVAGGETGYLAVGRVAEKWAVWRSANGSNWDRVPDAEGVVNQEATASVSAIAMTAQGATLIGRTSAGATGWFAEGPRWQQRPFTGDVKNDHPLAVTRTASGFLAVGSRTVQDRHGPASWSSSDGQTWKAASQAFPVEARPQGDTYGTSVQAVAQSGSGFVASGGGPSAKRVWKSADAVAWHEVSLPDPLPRANSFSLDLIAATAGDALFGSDRDDAPRLLLRRGEQWTEVTATERAFPPPRATAHDIGVVKTARGFLAWANTTQNGPRIEEEFGRVLWWRSADGRTWEPAFNDGPFELSFVVSVRELSTGLVAVGGTYFSLPTVEADDGLRAKAWISPDGLGWQRLDPGPDLPGNNEVLRGLVGRGDRTVAVGGTLEGADLDALFWTREGSGPWRALADVPGAVATGRQFGVAACSMESGLVAVGRGATSPIWFSVDGIRWRQVENEELAASQNTFEACVTGPAGFVAVGWRTVDSRQEGSIWTSQDGLQWSPAQGDGFKATGDVVMLDVAASGDDVLVVGWAEEEGRPGPALWRSSDRGRSWRRLALPSAFDGLFDSFGAGVVIDGETVFVSGIVDGRPVMWSSPLAQIG